MSIDCNTYECPSETHYQPTGITDVDCDDANDGDCLNKCCRPYSLCGQWSQYGNNRCKDNSIPYLSRIIPSNRLNLDIETVCCSDVKCSDYTCPIGYKIGSNVGPESLTYNSNSVYDPIGECCEKKTCGDWVGEGNSCGKFPIYDNYEERDGYSVEECCFRSCDRWAATHSSEENPCGLNILLRNKHGWGEGECCLEKENTCSNKDWRCPENTSMINENLDKECEGSISSCPKNEQNIEICCSPFNTCSNIQCPVNYHLNHENRAKSCKGRKCSISNDMDLCCLENEKCSNLDCGKGFSVPEQDKNKFCSKEKCSLKDDKEICCSSNNICSSLECPAGYYIREGSEEKTCYGGVCDPENRYDFIRCCKVCPPIENATEVICSTKDDSIATACKVGYQLENGRCEKDINVIKVKINIDSKYSDFIGIENYEELLINDLCSMINEGGDTELPDCETLIKVNSIKRHIEVDKEYTQVVVDLDSIVESIGEDISLLISNKLLTSLKLNTTDSSKIKNLEENVTCSSGVYNYECPFYMGLRSNAEEIYGSSDLVCCELNWDTLKYIVPLLLLVILVIYIFFKVKFGKRRRR